MATMAEIQSLIATQLGITESDVSASSRIVEDLGAESSDIANIVAAIEDKYGIKVPEEKIESFKTVQDIFAGVQSYTQ
jgi:acyl carrier protein